MLLDTDVVIWHMRGNAKAAALVERPGLLLSAVTQIELIQGLRNKRELSALRQSLRIWQAQVLPVTEAVSQRAVLLVERYFLSHSLRLADALIAATALEHGRALVTGNFKHYRAISDLLVERFSPNG